MAVRSESETRPASSARSRASADGGGERPEDGEHRVEVGEAGAEAVDEVGQGEVAVDRFSWFSAT